MLPLYANRSDPACSKRTKVPLSCILIQPRSMANLRPAEIFFRRAPIDVQERAVEFLYVNAAVLDRLECVRVLHQPSRGLFGISEGAVGGEFHGVMFSVSDGDIPA